MLICGSFKVLHTRRGYVKCQLCGKSKSLSRLRREITILQGFYLLQPAYRLSQNLGGTSKWLPVCTNASGKPCILWPSWKGETQKGRSSWMKPTLGAVGRANGDERRRAKAKHHTINHSKRFVSRSRVKNHINGIEGFWSYAKHIVYHYRGVSKYHFPMYLKEIEYRFNHRTENLLKRFLKIYFGYVSP